MKAELKINSLGGMKRPIRRVSHARFPPRRVVRQDFVLGLAAARMATTAFGSGKPDISELP
jgi:hypothetical protein